MPLTDQQRAALAQLRTLYANEPITLGAAESVDQRSRQPDPAHLPADVTVHVKIAPPSAHPHPLLLNTCPLRKPERVPIYFYRLQNDHGDTEVAETRVIFFIHGGGNVRGHPTSELSIRLIMHFLRAIASHAAGTHKCVVVAPTYRLATVPENAFPAALQDVSAAYDYILDKGYRASNIVLAGTSAGANHALVLTHLLLQSNQPPPDGLITFAPPAIQSHLSEQAKENGNTDILNIPMCKKLSDLYIGDSGVALSHPLISAAFIPFSVLWPKTLIMVGTGDLLIDGSREVKRRLSVSNLTAELVEYDERPHAWWSMPHIFEDDILDAAGRVARFVLELPSA